MDTFVWGPDFTTGIDSVDHQHHGLVDLFNELSDTLASGHEIDEAQAYLVFQKLLAYAEHHFGEEEALMKQSGVDERHITQQQELHHSFLDQLGTMWGAKETLSHPAEVFLSFLTSWLGLHILGIDQLMARQIRRIAAGGRRARRCDLRHGHIRRQRGEAQIVETDSALAAGTVVEREFEFRAGAQRGIDARPPGLADVSALVTHRRPRLRKRVTRAIHPPDVVTAGIHPHAVVGQPDRVARVRGQ